MTTFKGSTRTVTNEDQSWIGSDISLIDKIGGTADVSSFTEADHYADGALLSGIAVGQVTATGLYAPYNPTADLPVGAGTLVGYIFAARDVDLTDATADQDISIVVSATIREANLPGNGAGWTDGKGFPDANGKADNPKLRYI